MSETSSKLEPTALKHILFVDDEPNVLSGLRNVLRSQRRQWEMVFALGPEEALAKLAEQPFDVVVSDMRMPQMDGATLLSEVKRLQPKAVRIILTGQTEQETVLKSVFIAHMFLSKPCDPGLLKRVVDRACRLNSILNSEELRAAAGRVDMLPTAPKTYAALNEALIRPNCTVDDVARIIERDVGVCAKILQLVNSAFFGLPRKITSLNEAVTYMGTLTIKNLAMALEAFSSASRSCGLSKDGLNALQDHSLLAGQSRDGSTLEIRTKRKSRSSLASCTRLGGSWRSKLPRMPMLHRHSTGRSSVPTCLACGGCPTQLPRPWPTIGILNSSRIRVSSWWTASILPTI